MQLKSHLDMTHLQPVIRGFLSHTKGSKSFFFREKAMEAWKQKKVLCKITKLMGSHLLSLKDVSITESAVKELKILEK